jgi:hypothetical protein
VRESEFSDWKKSSHDKYCIKELFSKKSHGDFFYVGDVRV